MNIARLIALLGTTIYFSNNSFAEIIYQSGSLGQTGITWQTLLDDEKISGTGVNLDVYVGARFEIDQTVQTTRIGGHFVGHPLNPSNGFFGALIQLDNETDFPDSGDLSTADVLGVTTVTFPETSGVVFGDLTAMLDPGWYAVVFGSGISGMSGVGAALRNGIDDGSQSYIGWQPGEGWLDLSPLFPPLFANHYFVVEGTLVPEPSSIVLLGTCCVAMLLKRQRNGAVKGGKGGRGKGER